MDEATASIDVKTEGLIQTSINNYLKDSTVLTVAHRIKTVQHNDRILVLHKGEIAEFDTPQNLLSDTNSLFYKLYNKSQL
jgi:ATP-binding cassette subfamily C (CFTR/MRP) protein 1